MPNQAPQLESTPVRKSRVVSLRSLAGLALCASLAACGGRASNQSGQSGVPGQEGIKPGGGSFFVDENQSGGASRLRIAEMFWARLVDVHDVDPVTGEPSLQPIYEDFSVDENIQSDSLNYLLETNPVTQETRLVILRTKGGPALNGTTFDDLLRQSTRSLPPITPKNDDGSSAPPFSFVARNSCLVIRFNDCLDDSQEAQENLVETVKVFTGYPPTTPFSPRMLFDPNHGAVVGGAFHSTRLLVDLTVSEAESSGMGTPAPVNQLGLPASLTESGQPNVSVRIPSRVDAASGQFVLLTNLSGAQMATSANGPVDMGSPTLEVVRAMRSGNSANSNNGFLLDSDPPRVMGSWPMTVDSVEDLPGGALGFDFLVDMTFTTACREAPDEGDILSVGSRFLEVTLDGNDPDGAGTVVALRVRLLADAPLGPPDLLLGSGIFRSTYDTLSPVPVGCWVNFTPRANVFPTSEVKTTAQARLTFTEPMDPASLSAFDNFVLVRGPSTEDVTPTTQVVGVVRPSDSLRDFEFTPVLPLAHVVTFEDDFHIDLTGAVDLAGNPLVDELPDVDFTIDPVEPTQLNGSLTLRFDATDELEPAGLDDIRGQVFYDLERGIIKPRQVSFTGVPVDRSNPVPAFMVTLPIGRRDPLNPLGCRMMTVWRYCDLGWTICDETKYNMDVVGLNWSPVGGQVISDFFEGFEMRLAHSKFLPDEGQGAPLSGLIQAPMQFTDNLLVEGEQKIVHPRAFGYEVNPSDLFISPISGGFMFPYPMNRVPGVPTQTFTWRDTSIRTLGGPNGLGVPLAIENNSSVGADQSCLSSAMMNPPLATGEFAGPGQVPTVGLPLLIEYRCYPSNSGVGLNALDVAFASFPQLPIFRTYSSGGVDTSGDSISINPDTQITPAGGFNPASTPPGQPTNFTADPIFYMGQVDTVVRVSRAHTIWMDSRSSGGVFTADYVQPVIEPSDDLQPDGTQVVIEFRGADGFSAGVDDPFDAALLDAYGEPDPMTVTPTFFNGDPSWKRDISQIDGAQFIQARITFLNNIDTGLNAELSAIGIPYTE